MTNRLIQVGTGGQGAAWCANFLPPNVEDGRIEVVAAVDVDSDALANAREHLGLDPSDCYTDLEAAFRDNDADICAVVVPSHAHEEVIDAALAHGLDVLSEKPIADTLEASVRIAEKVERAGAKMGVTMSHRFDRDKTTLRRELRSGHHGPLDYLVGRFTCNCRSHGSWGAEWKYEMDDPLLIGGAVHQLDFLADMAGAPCETVYARTWNPPWSDFAGDPQAHAMLSFENGVEAVYEGAKANAAGLNGWGSDYLRAECRDATLILDDRELECHPYEPEREASFGGGVEGTGDRVPLAEREKWGNAWLIEQFVDWVEGGDPMPTNVEDTLRSAATLFAAIESSETGEPVDVRAFLRAARERIDADERGFPT